MGFIAIMLNSVLCVYQRIHKQLSFLYNRKKMNATTLVVLYFIVIILKFKELLETFGIYLPVTDCVLLDDISLRETLLFFTFSFPLHSSDLFVSENKVLNRWSILWTFEDLEIWVDGCHETSSIVTLGIWDCLRITEDGGLSIM